jgi:hypothetical protein
MGASAVKERAVKRGTVVAAGLLVVVGLALGHLAVGNGALPSGDTAIMVSPQMIVLDKVDTVTVHTNIPASTVDADTVTLDGAEPLAVWADNCGHLAARFAVEDLGLEPGEATLTLSGAGEGGTFSASDDVRVK